MSQIKQITTLIKGLLKQQNITYAALADELQMSEANVKRMFAKQALSLQRLERICEILQLSMSELFLLLERNKVLVSTLTHEQEQQLVNDIKLLLVAVCVHLLFRALLMNQTCIRSGKQPVRRATAP